MLWASCRTLPPGRACPANPCHVSGSIRHGAYAPRFPLDWPSEAQFGKLDPSRPRPATRSTAMAAISGTAEHSAEVRAFPRRRCTDAELVLALSRRDPEALRAVWDRYASMVQAALVSGLGSDASIDDLAQEVFLGLYRRAPKLRDPSALRAYLLGSAVRIAAFERRTRARRSRWLGMFASEATRARTSYPDVEDRDSVRALHRILESVAERPRMAFLLRYVHELSPASVAIALEVSEATAKRAIARGRARVLRLAAREPALRDYFVAGEDTNG